MLFGFWRYRLFVTMKSWIRSRRAESSSTSQESRPSPTIKLFSAPSPPSNHAWDTLTSVTRPNDTMDRANSSTAADQSLSSLQNPLGRSSIKQVMESAAAHISATPPTYQQHILVRSEHYFRLVLESWEQLRACHFKASQKFSLAEWMHIHALLLYGRIQRVRQSFNTDSVAQHNLIDLSSDVALFQPLATVLNSIGVVRDNEIGVTYIPDAVFPQASQSSFMAYTASEMQYILDGTMYDWQRSWKRVLEARHSRDTQHTKFALVRSSSELISAIREKSELIARIQQLRPLQEEEDIMGDDYKGELKKLNELLEEARNAKDYTILPPCARVYERADPARTFELPQLSTCVTSSISSEDTVSESISESPTKRENTDGTKGTGLPVSMMLPALSLDSEDDQRASPPLRSAMRKRSVQLAHLNASSESLGPFKGSSTDIVNSSDATLPSDSPVHEVTDAPDHQGSDTPVRLLPILGSANRSSTRKGQHVQLAGSADASDSFVHFDARVWDEYQAFVNALESTQLTKFGRLKKEPEGTYAWLLPVKLGEPKQSAEAPHRNSSMLTQPISPSRQQRAQVRLPRASIPKTEQTLALLLQTSSLKFEASDWHVETETELDMRQFVLDCVNTGILDHRAI